MAQKGRQLPQASLGIDAFSIPAQQCRNGEGVPLIPSSELSICAGTSGQPNHNGISALYSPVRGKTGQNLSLSLSEPTSLPLMDHPIHDIDDLP